MLPKNELRKKISEDLVKWGVLVADANSIRDFIFNKLFKNKDFITHLIQSGAVGIDEEALRKIGLEHEGEYFVEIAQAISAQGAKILKAK